MCELCATLSFSLSPRPSLSISFFLGWLRIYIAAYFQAYLWHALTSERAKIMQYNYGKARIWPPPPSLHPLPHPTYLCHCSVLFVRVVKNVTCLLRLSCALRLSKFRCWTALQMLHSLAALLGDFVCQVIFIVFPALDLNSSIKIVCRLLPKNIYKEPRCLKLSKLARPCLDSPSHCQAQSNFPHAPKSML